MPVIDDCSGLLGDFLPQPAIKIVAAIIPVMIVFFIKRNVVELASWLSFQGKKILSANWLRVTLFVEPSAANSTVASISPMPSCLQVQ